MGVLFCFFAGYYRCLHRIYEVDEVFTMDGWTVGWLGFPFGGKSTGWRFSFLFLLVTIPHSRLQIISHWIHYLIFQPCVFDRFAVFAVNSNNTEKKALQAADSGSGEARARCGLAFPFLVL